VPDRLYAVTSLMSHAHHKHGSPTSLRLNYYNGGREVACEWLLLEHFGRPRDTAAAQWRRLGGRDPIPTTTHEALGRVGAELRHPSVIKVREVKGWDKIVSMSHKPLPE
jgi:hypothetical protein